MIPKEKNICVHILQIAYYYKVLEMQVLKKSYFREIEFENNHILKNSMQLKISIQYETQYH